MVNGAIMAKWEEALKMLMAVLLETPKADNVTNGANFSM